MGIVTEQQQQVLEFVAACNRSAYYPTPDEVLAWLESPEPKTPVYKTRPRSNPLSDLVATDRQRWEGLRSGLLAAGGPLASPVSSDLLKTLYPSLTTAMSKISAGVSKRAFESIQQTSSDFLEAALETERVMVSPGETVVEHLVRIGWLEDRSETGPEDITGPEDDGEVDPPAKLELGVTLVGMALLAESYREVVHGDLSEVVLDSGDALAYPRLLGRLSQVGAGLLVDPYIEDNHIYDLMINTEIDRVLMKAPKDKKDRRTAEQAATIAVFLASGSVTRRLEVRASTKLHDRAIVADNGDVYTLGTSLNGVGGRAMTVLCPQPAVAAEVLDSHYNELWRNGTVIGCSSGPPGGDDDQG